MSGGGPPVIDADEAPPEPVDAAPSSLVPNLSDLGNARRLVAAHGAELRYCPSTGWLVWDGKRWRVDDLGAVYEKAKRVTRVIYAEAATTDDPDARKRVAAWARQSENATRIEAMVKLARTDPRIAVRHDQLDADPWALNVANGTIDLRTGELRPHRPRDLITKLAPVDYDPAATSPLWEGFLERILPAAAVRAFVGRLLGYGTAGVSVADVFPILHGYGRNGKSTFIGAVSDVLGDYAMACEPDLLLETKHGVHPESRARLAGKRLVSAVEVGRGRRLNEAFVKQLTGGDKIPARHLYGREFEITPTWLVLFAVNHRPGIRGTDEAIWRRVVLVPFEVTIPEDQVEAGLRDRLPGEAGQAILAWLVRGCLAWQREGLNPPEEVRVATAAYRADSDDIGRFLADRCDTSDPRALTLFGDLYLEYEKWAKDAATEAVGKKLFGTLLTERGIAGHTPTRGPKARQAHRLGVRLAELRINDPSADDADDLPELSQDSLSCRTLGESSASSASETIDCLENDDSDPPGWAGDWDEEVF